MKFKINLKLLCIFLIILYILYILFIIFIIKYKKTEKFTNILELLNTSLENNKKHQYPITVYEDNNDIDDKSKNIIKKDIKYIYLLKIKNKYIFYNKNLKQYMTATTDYNQTINNILLKDSKNKIVGNLISEKYNNMIVYLKFYNKNSNFEYLKNFKEIKFYLDNDDKYFFIKKDKKNIETNIETNIKNINTNTKYRDNTKYNSNNSSNYMIYLFNLLIGKIVYNNDKKIYKIMCYQEYKTYLNLFGIGLTFLITN